MLSQVKGDWIHQRKGWLQKLGVEGVKYHLLRDFYNMHPERCIFRVWDTEADMWLELTDRAGRQNYLFPFSSSYALFLQSQDIIWVMKAVCLARSAGQNPEVWGSWKSYAGITNPFNRYGRWLLTSNLFTYVSNILRSTWQTPFHMHFLLGKDGTQQICQKGGAPQNLRNYTKIFQIMSQFGVKITFKYKREKQRPLD